MNELKCDVAIIGGGPAGSTVGTLLRKYNPALSVVILEREQFPRDHVGESQLPAIAEVLEEMGVWNTVEAADFPIKIGGTYRWGTTDELWDFDFLPGEEFKNEPRPAKYVGQRRETAFQVDRSIYDKILLDHAASVGCTVLQNTKVTQVNRDGDTVTGLSISTEPGYKGEALPAQVKARYYVDASGQSGIMRRAMDIAITAPTALRNIAIWDYWIDAQWAVTLGTGGTRIQITSLGWGWVWFIPITPTRTSIGLVLPADYFKKTGKTKEELYFEAITNDPLVSQLIKNAHQEGNVRATNDWNFLSDRLYGENWFLAGDCCGFADPILSAGMTLAHSGARAVAYSILELDRGEHDGAWLKEQYNQNQRRQIKQHMMFADFWYSANGRFTELKEYCSEIAKTAGFTLDADAAFQWLGTGGFTNEVPGIARAATWRLKVIKLLTQHFSGTKSTFEIAKYNRFYFVGEGAVETKFAVYQKGQIIPVRSLELNGKTLPLAGSFMVLHHALSKEPDAERLITLSLDIMREMKFFGDDERNFNQLVDALEAMMAEGWVRGEIDPERPFLQIEVPTESTSMHPNRDNIVQV
jgi:flavin-dependent dehydrogenase